MRIILITLLNKIAPLDIPDHVDFFDGHIHQAKYGEQMSSLRPSHTSTAESVAITDRQPTYVA